MILPRQINLAQLAYIQHQMDEEAEKQTRIIKARELYAGYIDPELALSGADIYLGQDETDVEGVNLVAIAVNTTVRRITLQKFVILTPKDLGDGSIEVDDAGMAAIQTWINKVVEVNRLTNIAKDLHRWTERDGEAFLVLDYDIEYEYMRDPAQVGIPKMYVHERYTSADNSWKGLPGTNEGLKAHYRNGDVNQPLDMVSKRWIEEYWEDDEIKQRNRMTLYIGKVGSELAGDVIAARIEKYYLDEAGTWANYQDPEDEGWPIWWTDNETETGVSMPIPVIHFRNEEYEPGQKKIWGLQTSMDQQWIAFNNSNLMSGHQLLVAFGFYPTKDGQPVKEDGSNLMTVGPRRIIGTQSKAPREASVEAINPPSAESLLNGLDKTAIYCSFVGSLPVSNFIFSKSVASSETLKQGDAELVARVNELKGLWSESWSMAMDIARKMENVFNGGNLAEGPKIVPQFSPSERRDMEHLQKEATAKRDAGVPEEILLQEIWGYTPEQAADFIAKNLQEHADGVGPEVVAITKQMSMVEDANAAKGISNVQKDESSTTSIPTKPAISGTTP